MLETEAPPALPATPDDLEHALAQVPPEANRSRRRVVAGAAALLLLAGAAQALSWWHLGWIAVIAAVVVAVRLQPASAEDGLGRSLQVLWWLVAGLMVIGWAGPFLPVLAEPWVAVVVVALWALPGVARRGLVGGGGGGTWAAARAWSAALLPTTVFAYPYLSRGFADRLSLLGFGWDNAYHVLMLQGILKAHGYPVLDPAAVDSMPVSLLSYPQGPHQAWASLLRLAGIDAAAPELVVDGYIGVAILSYALLGLSIVWAYRRLSAPRLPWPADLAALALIAGTLALAPLPMLWRSGFFNYAVALAACAMSLGVVARPRAGGSVRDLVLASALLVVVATSYPLIAPVPAVVWLVLAARLVRGGPGHAGVSRVLVVTVLTALACFPAAVPYVISPVLGGDLVLFGGGLAQVPLWMVALLLVGSAAVVIVRIRAHRAAWGLAWAWLTAWLLTAGLAGWSLVQQGYVSYYPDKVMLVALVLSIPLAAAGTAGILAGLAADRGRRSWLLLAVILGGGALVVVGSNAVTPMIPRDPVGRLVPWPGPDLLEATWPAGSAYFSQGDRIIAGANAPQGWGGAVPVTVDWLLPPVAQAGASWMLEQRWMWVLSPTNGIAAQWLATTLQSATSWQAVAGSVARWARTNPGTGVALVVGDEGSRDQLVAALDGVDGGRPPGIVVRLRPMPIPMVLALSWIRPGDNLPTVVHR